MESIVVNLLANDRNHCSMADHTDYIRLATRSLPVLQSPTSYARVASAQVETPAENRVSIATFE